MTPLRERRRTVVLLGGIVALAGLTALMRAAPEGLDRVHIALLYLLVVLAASAAGGRWVGSAVALTAFVTFNFFFIPPYHTLAIARAADWIVLLVFLVAGLVSAQLLHLAQREAALREANRLKDSLLASVSHDLRTPLTTIRGLAHQLLEEGDERAAVIVEETDRLSRFVGDMLDLSLLRAGGLPNNPAINAADDLLGAALQQIAGVAEGRSIVASLDPSEPMLAGRFDFMHALRILVNLLENALRYAPATSAIELSVRKAQENLVFTVADRGPGIPSRVLARLFDSVTPRADTDAPGTRTGLGLTIAHALARQQGGRLEYRARDGGGSEFLLYLPAVDLSRELGG